MEAAAVEAVEAAEVEETRMEEGVEDMEEERRF